MLILFLLASIGVINGLMISAYLIARKDRTVTDIYFAGLLLALCIRIGKSVWFYFSDEVDRLILQVGLSACIFIGPFFYLYTKSIHRNALRFQRGDLGILSILLVTIVIVGSIWPYRQFPEVWNGQIIYGIYAIWLLFVLGGLYHGIKVFNGLIFKPSAMSSNQQYLLVVTISIIFITLTYQTALYIGYTYIWGALIFSFSFYFLSIRALMGLKPVVPKSAQTPLVNGQELLLQVKTVMAQEKLFLNQGLKLDELAESAGLSKHTLSKLLNEEYELGFSNFIKEYRVEEAKRLIETRPELSLEGIGYEAGFSSKSAFFEAFKKMTHSTPAQYKSLLEQSITS